MLQWGRGCYVHGATVLQRLSASESPGCRCFMRTRRPAPCRSRHPRRFAADCGCLSWRLEPSAVRMPNCELPVGGSPRRHLVWGWPSAARVNMTQPTQAADMLKKLARFGAKSAVKRPTARRNCRSPQLWNPPTAFQASEYWGRTDDAAVALGRRRRAAWLTKLEPSAVILSWSIKPAVR